MAFWALKINKTDFIFPFEGKLFKKESFCFAKWARFFPVRQVVFNSFKFFRKIFIPGSINKF